MCMFCRSLLVLLSFFFWPLRCLSFNLRVLVTPLVSSHYSNSSLSILLYIYWLLFLRDSQNVTVLDRTPQLHQDCANQTVTCFIYMLFCSLYFKIFTGCHCIGQNATASPGLCKPDCDMLYAYVALFFIFMMTQTIGLMPNYIFTMRYAFPSKR